MLLIKNGLLVTSEKSFQADILVDGEKIKTIGENLQTPGAKIVDAEGKLVMPGGVDPHVHLDLPMFNTVSSDDHYTGTKAAAFGGTTTVLDFIPQPENAPLLNGYQEWRAMASPKAAVDYSFHMNITSLKAHTLEEIPGLLDVGINTVKVFTAYNNRLRLMDDEIFQVMRVAEKAGLLTMLHAENGDVIEVLTAEALAAGHTEPVWHARTRPAWGAVESVLRACALAAQADAKVYIVHMNTSGGLDQLNYARSKGVRAMGETCPPYLFFSEEHLARPDGAKWICSPPMRSQQDNNALWQGITGSQIQTMGTDHCPFFYDGRKPIMYEGKQVAIPGKELGADDFTKIPNGLPGVGDRLPIIWSYGVNSGKMTPEQFVAMTSTNPAKIFGMYPRKGALQAGSDADILIWDPDRELEYGVEHAQHRTDYNLYQGWKLKGYPHQVYLRGNLIVDQERWLGGPGEGTYIHREAGEFL